MSASPPGWVGGRLGALRALLARRGIGWLVVVSRHNLAYLTGAADLFHAGFFGLGVVGGREAVLITDRRYEEAARQYADDGPWRLRVAGNGLAAAVADVVGSPRRAGRVAVEAQVSHLLFSRLSRALGREPRPTDGLIERLRRAKSPHEVEAIHRAAALTDRAFRRALELVRPGVAERDLALEIEYFMRSNGASAVAFDPIVASGPNASRPHAEAGSRLFRRGELIKIDIGAVVDGYCADLTRTVALGRVDDERRQAHRHVLEAQKRALEALSVGTTGREADRAARGYLRSVGWADRFTHGLGHGVGIQVHEAPTLGPRAGGKLRAGDVFTVEPGVYVEGRFGVRIEDLVVLTAQGVHNLSRSTRRLIVL